MPVATGVDEPELRALAGVTRTVPDGFTLHPKLARQFAQRDTMVAAGQVDWSLAEALAIGSSLAEGTDVRLTGQDTRRGTFSQRHAVLVDYVTGDEFVPLSHLPANLVPPPASPGGLSVSPGHFTVRDSLLSEYAAVGFEYGYSVESPDALVAWEAQFGDFVNGAEIIIDNFLVAAEDKWGQHAGLVLLLPHGYEGQGPEHSSARIERFLSLAANGNLRIAVAVHGRPVLPPPPGPGPPGAENAAGRLHAEVPPPGPRVPLPAFPPDVRLLRRGPRRSGRGRRRGGPAGGPVQRQGRPRGAPPP